MAYTLSPIEAELARKDKLITGWPWRLLVISLIILGSMMAIYFGITLGFKSYLDSKIQDTDNKMDKLVKSVSDEQQKNILNFYSQLNNISDLLKSRNEATNYLAFLERNVLKNVYLNSLTLSFKGNIAEVGIDGQTSNYDFLSQQMGVFNSAPEIDKVFLQNSRVEEQKDSPSTVNFSIRLIFKKQL